MTVTLKLIPLILLPCLLGDSQLALDKAALDPIQYVVGSWKGVGRPGRGNARGAWREQSSWSWKFKEGRAWLTFASPRGKYFAEGTIRPGKEEKTYILEVVDADDTKETYTGAPGKKKGQFVFTADKPGAGRPARLTFRSVANGDRLIILLEKKLGKTLFTRMAEIGYTRVGSGFGKGASGPVCIVTGGAGSMSVSYKGKTYYVCCGGCRDAFNEDPEAMLKEAAERAAKKKAEDKE